MAAGGAAAGGATHFVWQDREIRFDSPPKDVELRPGEIVVDSLNSVEDTKGNNGERGALQITNLRILWHSHRNFTVNLSIGYSTIQTITIRSADSRLKGRSQALYLMTRYGGNRFEFIFTSLVKSSPRLFTTVQAVFRAYETSKLYRDLKLRGAIVHEGHLRQLPEETIFSKIDGVWNLSAEQGNLGVFYITNVSVVWHAILAENFNVSIPWIQVASIVVRNSRFGRALVLETSPASGGYVLGFRVDPAGRLDDVHRELHSLHEVYAAEPILGVRFSVEDTPEPLEAVTVPAPAEDVEIVNDADAADTMAAYFADASKTTDRDVVFSPELGLAVESLPEGYTLEKLWSAV